MRAILVFATLGLVAAAALPAKDEERHVQLGNDMFRAGDHVELEDNVQGDALLAGGEVELRSSVGGDAVATGGDVEIGGSVGQDLYAAGGRITVTGTIGGSARIAGGEIELADTADIADGASIAGGKIRLRGHVGRYLQIAGGEVRIDGRVDGDVNVSTGELVIGPDAVIEGRLTHRGPRPARVSSEARVTGGVHHVQERYDGRVFRRVFGAFAFVWLLGWTLIGVLLLALLPQATRTITDVIRARPGASALLGFAFLIGVPIVILIAAITLVGIPLAILLVLLYFVLLPLGYLASVVGLVDSLLPRVRRGKPVTTALRIGAFVLAAFVLYLLTRIDFLGGLITLALVIVGVGGLAFAARPGVTRGTPDPAV